MKILVTQNIPKEGLVEIFNNHTVIMPEKGGFTLEEQKELIKDADILLSIFNSPVDRDLIDSGDKLKMISNFGVGYNNIDIQHAKQKGIIVTNTPDPVTLPTAEHTMSLMLAVMRRISEMDRRLRAGSVSDWKVMSNLGNTLNNKVLGIIGLGKIGKATAKIAQAFGMKIVYHNRKELSSNEEQDLQALWLPLNILLEESDVVSMHVPLTDETNGIIGKKELMTMKKSAFLINTARGQVINEQALVDALLSNEISGAGLDVFQDEPNIHPELLKMDNVVLTPHIGTGTIETRIDIAKCAADNIISFINNNEITNRIV